MLKRSTSGSCIQKLDTIFSRLNFPKGNIPKTEYKLSLGFAKIIGSPSDSLGVNVRSQSNEREGDGERGPKASEMLMVD